MSTLGLRLALGRTDHVKYGSGCGVSRLLCRIENRKHGNFPGRGSDVVHDVVVVGPSAGPISSRGDCVRVAHLRGIKITIQVLNPIGIASIRKVMCRSWGCVLRVTHFDPLHTWAAWRRAWWRWLLP